MSKKRGIHWGFADRSFWEWLLLVGTLLAALGALAIPFVVTIIGLNFTQQQAQLSIASSERQHQTDLLIANDQQQEATLESYLDDMAALLLSQNLENQPITYQDIWPIKPEVAIIARAKTLIVLRRLPDPKRKAVVMQFLYEARLIGYVNYPPSGPPVYYPSVIDLNGADLSHADLSSTNLEGADLNGVILNGANLRHAELGDADLRGAQLNDADLQGIQLGRTPLTAASLRGADLQGVYLSGAELSYADLSGANLRSADLDGAYLDLAKLDHADLSGADLSSADLIGTDLDSAIVTKEQLDSAKSLQDAIMPDGSKHP